MEFVYEPAVHVSVKLTKEVTRVPINPGPPAANTQGATSRKEQAQVADKGKLKMDMDKGKGKGKVIELEKPKKTAPFPLQPDGAFKIYEKDPIRPTPPVIQPVKREKKRSFKGPPRVARVLKLVDEEEDLEAGQPTEATSVPVSIPIGDSKVEVVEVPLLRKKTLKKVADAPLPEVEPVVR